MSTILFLIVALFIAGAADAVPCTEGLTQQIVAGNTLTVNFGSTVESGEYGDGIGNVWDNAQGFPSDTTVDGLTFTGSQSGCWRGGRVVGPMQPEQDSITYYECSSGHGHTSGDCLPYHTTAAVAANMSGPLVIEGGRFSGWGDGVSVGEGTADVTVRGSLFTFTHDDGIEYDFCDPRDFVIEDNNFDRVLLMFAFDLRSAESSCSTFRGDWLIRNNIGRLHEFTHSYEEDTMPGVFKDDGNDNNPNILEYTTNVFVLGPTESGQLMFPPNVPEDCYDTVYLWTGTQAAWDATMDNAGNQAAADAIEDEWPGCITVVVKDSGETVAQFLARDLAELGNQSYNDIDTAWRNDHFPTGGGTSCGIGFELALLLPLLGAARRRVRGR